MILKHGPKQSPAYGKKCAECRKRNHHARKCRQNNRAIDIDIDMYSTDESQTSRSDEQMMTVSLQPETEGVYTVTDQTDPRQQCAIMQVRFQLDAGAW